MQRNEERVVQPERSARTAQNKTRREGNRNCDVKVRVDTDFRDFFIPLRNSLSLSLSFQSRNGVEKPERRGAADPHEIASSSLQPPIASNNVNKQSPRETRGAKNAFPNEYVTLSLAAEAERQRLLELVALLNGRVDKERLEVDRISVKKKYFNIILSFCFDFIFSCLIFAHLRLILTIHPRNCCVRNEQKTLNSRQSCKDSRWRESALPREKLTPDTGAGRGRDLNLAQTSLRDKTLLIPINFD